MNINHDYEIIRKLCGVIGSAENDLGNARYHLEKLPMVGGYDSAVNKYIIELEKAIVKWRDPDDIDDLISEMVEYYSENWDAYKNKF